MSAPADMALVVAPGNPRLIALPERFILGDTANCDCSYGPAPEVRYDEIYFGPLLPALPSLPALP